MQNKTLEIIWDNKSPQDITYGFPLRSSTSINAVMSNFYGRLAIKDLDSIYSQTDRPGFRISSSKGSELLKKSKIKPETSSEKSLFKVKKFSKVKSRACWRDTKKTFNINKNKIFITNI